MCVVAVVFSRPEHTILWGEGKGEIKRKKVKRNYSLHSIINQFLCRMLLERNIIVVKDHLRNYPTNDKVSWLIKFMKNRKRIIRWDASS